MVLEQTLLQSLAVGAEGLMLKFLDSRCAYQPSKRSDSWLKLKKDYCEGLRDSLDLVCFGYGGAGVLVPVNVPGDVRLLRCILHSSQRAV